MSGEYLDWLHLLEETVAATVGMSRYDDWTSPDVCPACGPDEPAEYVAARQRLSARLDEVMARPLYRARIAPLEAAS